MTDGHAIQYTALTILACFVVLVMAGSWWASKDNHSEGDD